MSGKQCIFISSVQKELALERRAVKDFIHADPLLSRFFEVFLFEDLPAADLRADAVYLSEVDRCTLYLALFGNDYGFGDAQGISPTEREFDRATTLGKPRLIYVRGGDDGARHLKMRALVRKAGDQLIRRRFGDTPALIAAIHASLVDHLVDQAPDFVLSKIARSVGTRAAGAQAPVDYELPREAVAEAIVNAVAHRDYTSNASVQVMLFADRLEIWNPGELPPQLTVDNLRRPHASIPRSPRIAEPLFLARYIEKAGTGTLDMINLCAQAGLPAPEFRQDGGQFIQTLWRPKGTTGGAEVATAGTKPGTKSGPSGDQVEILAKASTGAALTDLMAVVNRTNRTKFRDQVIQPLMDQDLLEMTHPDSPRSPQQKYRLTAQGQAWLANQTEKKK